MTFPISHWSFLAAVEHLLRKGETAKLLRGDGSGAVVEVLIPDVHEPVVVIASPADLAELCLRPVARRLLVASLEAAKARVDARLARHDETPSRPNARS